MNRKIVPVGGSGQVRIPSSKSDVHRILIAAALADQPTEVEINGISNDIGATMECLKALGARIENIEDLFWRVTPIDRTKVSGVSLDCGESGSTLRFILPVAGVLTDCFHVRAEGRLPKRPLTDLTTQMKEKGCSFSAEYLPFTVSGRLIGGRYTLPGNISSQYVTGLMFALPLLTQNSEIHLTTELESRAYVDMTLTTLKQFGIEILIKEYGYFIPGGQVYHSPGRITAEGDWSGAAFFLAAGALRGPMICRGLNQITRQGDRAVLDVLQKFGAQIHYGEEITIERGTLNGTEIDAAEIPDLIPALAAVAAGACGVTRIYHAGRLRIKESDRLSALSDGLSRLGVTVREEADELWITGQTAVQSGVARVSSYGDHRIVMAMTVAALSTGREIIIEGTEAVEKSYPDFFTSWEQTGGRADVI